MRSFVVSCAMAEPLEMAIATALASASLANGVLWLYMVILAKVVIFCRACVYEARRVSAVSIRSTSAGATGLRIFPPIPGELLAEPNTHVRFKHSVHTVANWESNLFFVLKDFRQMQSEGFMTAGAQVRLPTAQGYHKFDKAQGKLAFQKIHIHRCFGLLGVGLFVVVVAFEQVDSVCAVKNCLVNGEHH